MIKKEKTIGDTTVVTYICDNCVKAMPGAPILVYFPYGHINDSLDGPSHFCSDKCLVEFEEKLVKKYGPWKSKEEVQKGKRVRSSAEWRKGKVTNPKARRVVRRVKKIFRRKPSKKADYEKDQEEGY